MHLEVWCWIGREIFTSDPPPFPPRVFVFPGCQLVLEYSTKFEPEWNVKSEDNNNRLTLKEFCRIIVYVAEPFIECTSASSIQPSTSRFENILI